MASRPYAEQLGTTVGSIISGPVCVCVRARALTFCIADDLYLLRFLNFILGFKKLS